MALTPRADCAGLRVWMLETARETTMNSTATTRRALMGGVAGLATFGTRGALAAAPLALPPAPVMLNVIDVAGQLQLTQRAMEQYAKANPKVVSKISFSQAPAPELPGKIKAQQDAGRVDIDLVLTGTDGLAAGIDQKLWVPLVTDYASELPKLAEIYLPGALKMQALAQDQAVCVVFCPAGPIIEYMPDAVKQAPKTAQELLDWTKAHPKRFIYARPANSGPGRTFLQGLPYILGDKDPMDPDKGWDKTWAYLVELGKNIEYYPTGTGAVMKELAEGSRDMIASHLGWDLNPRILGVVPMEAQIGTLEGFHWVTDAQYWAIPKGVSQDKLAVLLDMTRYMLSKPAQAMTWDKGYFYPGPAVKDVPLSMAPQDSQDAVNGVRRDFIDKLITEVPSDVPLPADKLVFAFQRWDQQVGARVGK
jgi:putative spermidine/putrescine transport system substrate-binding protein